MNINLINTLAQPTQFIAKFINSQEQASGLSTSRFIQDTSTCLLPKAALSRSKADLVENSFLEISESALVYFTPAIIGEKIARKFFSRSLKDKDKKLIAFSAKELMGKNTVKSRQVLAIKAAIALTAMIIPITEFTLNYFKNLLTLKAFKKADFNNIVELQNSKEDKFIQEKVEKSAHKNIKRGFLAYLGCALTALVMVHPKLRNSQAVQHLSETILAPGTKFFKKNSKKQEFFDKYFSLDFNQQDGKLVLSKGQLTACVLIGGLGYFGASKDRGKQNFYETLFRFPIVGFYIITGSELFEKGFKKILLKAGKCKETIDNNLNTPNFNQLEQLASKLATKNKTNLEQEFKKLAKQKILISGVPFIFSIGFIGFFVIAISNFFTKFRFDQDKQAQKTSVCP